MHPVVVFGASGLRGRRVASALLRRGVPVVLAGRDEAKLREARAALGADATLELRVADARDPAALRAMLEGASAVVSTVGDFVRSGEAVVEAAIAARVHYVDTSTEQAFQRRVRERFHTAAKGAGVAVLPGQGELALGILGAAALEARFGPLHRVDAYFDLGELEARRGEAGGRVATLGAPALRFEAGRFVPLAPSPIPHRTELPSYDAAPFTVPFAGAEAALLPHDMPSLRAAASHRVLGRAEAHAAALGATSRELLRPLFRPQVVDVLARAVDRVAHDDGDETPHDERFKVVVAGTSRSAHHACVLRGPSASGAASEVAALVVALLAEGRAQRMGVLGTGAALDARAVLAELERTGIRATFESRPRATEPAGRHEVRTTAIAKAPADEVWARLLETNVWSRWNGSLAGLRGDIREGEKVRLVVSAKGGHKLEIPVRVEAVETERELRWSGGVAGLMRGTHYFRLEAIDDTHTRITHGERFDGAIAAVSWPLLAGPLQAAYQQITDQLARQFETRSRTA